ncbi:MAG: thiamine-phosphate kinase [Patulibacter minatonensis]
MARNEFELIAAFRERLPAPGWRVEVGSGDDAAVVRAGGARQLVSVDTTVDGTHARLDLGDPIDAARAFGWRAITTAASDLAACGAPTGEAYVALTAPKDLPDDVLLAIADGLGDAARELGLDVIGGDVTSGPTVIISTTVVGWLGEHEPPLTRSGARPGDLVGLTGPIGAAGAGLALTLAQVGADAVDDATSRRLREAHLRPWARTDIGRPLRDAGATAAIDLSDGLLADAGHIARASGVVLDFDPAAVPIADGVADVAALLGAPSALVFAQAAGEDFELLVTVPLDHALVAEELGIAHWVGIVRAPEGEEQPGVVGLPAPADGRAGHDHRS